uniref:Uncharacterized protein n=5 Tax=Panicoideae TaxID=147369 RepID=B4FMR0_MAIZE|nr:unknown [Zea mays]
MLSYSSIILVLRPDV